MRTVFAVAPAATFTAHLSLIGEDVVMHDHWDAAVEHVATTIRLRREDLWFRPGARGMLAFNGWRAAKQEPIACILTPKEYQEARSRGDLEDPFLLPPHVALGGQNHRAGPELNSPIRRFTQPETTMKTQPTKSDNSEPLPAYLVLVDGKLMWRAKAYTRGDLIFLPPRDKKEEQSRALHLKKGWIRLATEEERNNPRALEATSQPDPKCPVTESADGTFELLDPCTIAPSPVNPRRYFDPDGMRELADSVKAKGVRVAINVRPVPPDSWHVQPWQNGSKKGFHLCDRRRGITTFDPGIMQVFFDTEAEAQAALPKYELIAGERRWRASRMAESPTIRAIIEHLDDEAAAELQVIENEQREDLKALERAAGYKHLLSLPSYSMDKLVQRVGKAKNTIWGYLKMLDAPEVVQQAVEKSRVTPAVAEMIGRQPEARRELVAKEILRLSAPHNQPLTFDAAKGVVERLRKEEETEAARLKATQEAQAKGLKVLTSAQSQGVVGYGSELAHNSGYVKATEKCPRDPNGRTWRQVVKGQGGVDELAVVHWSYNANSFVTIPVYEREQVNAVLRKLGLWNAEGSKKAAELEEKRQKKAKHGRDREAMMQDFFDIDAHVTRTKNPRGALLAALWAHTTGGSNPAAVFVAKRRAWIDLTSQGHRVCPVIRSLGTNLSNGELAGLVTELSVAYMDYEHSYYRSARKEIRELLEIGVAEPMTGVGDEDDETASADVRTAEHPGEAVAA